jgi:hypothetical protein
MNEYSLNEKQLIRSIGDFIINDPVYFSQIFRNSDIYEVFPPMKDIVQYIQTNETYDVSVIKEHMDNINDITIRNIFIHAFDYWSRKK